jgi:hypothetical protein
MAVDAFSLAYTKLMYQKLPTSKLHQLTDHYILPFRDLFLDPVNETHDILIRPEENECGHNWNRDYPKAEEKK